jgi:hypothetical protein
MYVVPAAKPADEIIAGCIALWKNAWPDTDKTIKEIENTIEAVESLTWEKAYTFAEQEGVETNVLRTNSHFSLNGNALASEKIRQVSNSFFDLTAACAQWYTQNFGIEEQIQFREGFNLLRYQTGQEYNAHYDGGTSTGRAISPILYLNDDYTGGEIEFVNQKITIKPKSGDFLIFPANFAFSHIAHPVKMGTKYAIVTWLHDR